VSSSKADRTTAPLGKDNRPSRAKQVRDRNVTPPVRKLRDNKSKPGEHAMNVQLAVKAPPPAVIDVDSPPEKDLWWTPERERCYEMTLVHGLPKTQIAKELGRERHTISVWQEDDRFIARLQEENVDRFRASRQRRAVQTVRLTDKAHNLADKMLVAAEKRPKDIFARSAARDWLNEFREQSRREDEIFGLDKQRVDVNVSGGIGIGVTHSSRKGAANLSFKDFLTTSMKKLGVDVDAEEIDGARADEALVAITERALLEGTFLEELVEREKLEKLNPLVPNER